MNSRALCIGCGDAIMERDAQDIAAALLTLGYRDITLIASRGATKNKIKEGIAGVLEGAPANSTVVFYFSCHACTDESETLWLLPHDAPVRPSHPESVGINATELRAACLDNTANVLVILDCCYAGAIATDNLGKLSRKWREGPGCIFLTSCGPTEATVYLNGARNSPLTAAVLRVLRSNCSARNVAKRVKEYFSDKPYWGRSLRAEERGRDFALVASADESNEE